MEIFFVCLKEKKKAKQVDSEKEEEEDDEQQHIVGVKKERKIQQPVRARENIFGLKFVKKKIFWITNDDLRLSVSNIIFRMVLFSLVWFALFFCLTFQSFFFLVF